MWILIIFFLFLPLISYQQLADRPIENTPDYTMQDVSPEIAQFASYTNAVRTKASLGPKSDKSYWQSWTDAVLEDYKSSPVLKFPSAGHGNCASQGQTIEVKTTEVDSSGNPVTITKTTNFRIAWIEPKGANWKKYTKYYNERYFGIHEANSTEVKTKGTWGTISLCDVPTNVDTFIFAIEQEP